MTICIPSMQEWGALFGAEPGEGAAHLQRLRRRQRRPATPLRPAVRPPRAQADAADRPWRSPSPDRVLAALAPDLDVLIAARILQGAGGAAGMAVGRAMVQDLFQGPERTRVMAYIGMAMGLCPPLATIIGGQVHVRFGWQANFYLLAAAGAGAVPGGLAMPAGAPACRRRAAALAGRDGRVLRATRPRARLPVVRGHPRHDHRDLLRLPGRRADRPRQLWRRPRRNRLLHHVHPLLLHRRATTARAGSCAGSASAT